MIDTSKLRELVQLMVDNDLSELDLQDERETVTIKRGGPAAPPVVHHAYAPQNGAAHQAPAAAAAPAAPAPAGDSGLKPIESPMVGTFYAGANPDSPPFITPGAAISAGSTLCLIEAMKVFNEIKAEIDGTVQQILVKNGQAVEFGQKLFLVKPS